MNVFIIGASGLVGTSLANLYTGEDYICRTCFTNQSYYSDESYGATKVDIANKKQVGELFASMSEEPDIVFVPAAITDVDFCEKNPEETWKTNVLGVKNVVDIIKGSDTIFVYYSSDFVFDGKEGIYLEDSLPNPINEYGRQKLIAEHYIASNLEKYYIIRTNIVFGLNPNKTNYFLKTLDELRLGHIINSPIDEWGTPTYAPDLADLSIKLAKSEQVSGIYHIGGSQVVNRYKFTLAIARIFELDERLVVPVQSHTLGRPARRPLNGGLKCTTSIQVCCGYEEGLLQLRELEKKAWKI